jgi:hypothetical protein
LKTQPSHGASKQTAEFDFKPVRGGLNPKALQEFQPQMAFGGSLAAAVLGPAHVRDRRFDGRGVDDWEGFAQTMDEAGERVFGCSNTEQKRRSASWPPRCLPAWERPLCLEDEAPWFDELQLKSPIGENNCRKKQTAEHRVLIRRNPKEVVFIRVLF